MKLGLFERLKEKRLEAQERRHEAAMHKRYREEQRLKRRLSIERERTTQYESISAKRAEIKRLRAKQPPTFWGSVGRGAVKAGKGIGKGLMTAGTNASISLYGPPPGKQYAKRKTTKKRMTAPRRRRNFNDMGVNLGFGPPRIL